MKFSYTFFQKHFLIVFISLFINFFLFLFICLSLPIFLFSLSVPYLFLSLSSLFLPHFSLSFSSPFLPLFSLPICLSLTLSFSLFSHLSKEVISLSAILSTHRLLAVFLLKCAPSLSLVAHSCIWLANRPLLFINQCLHQFLFLSFCSFPCSSSNFS